MRYEVVSLEPARLAKICAAVYGAVALAGAVVLLPFLLLAGFLQLAGSGPGMGMGEALFFFLYLVLGPIGAVVVAWLAGYLAGLVYNVVVRWTGCLQLELREVGEPPRPTPPL